MVSVTTVPWVGAHGPMAPPQGGEYGREKARVGAPMAPPIGFVPVSFTGKFADNLGLIACELITWFLYSSMVLFEHARDFFWMFVL